MVLPAPTGKFSSPSQLVLYPLTLCLQGRGATISNGWTSWRAYLSLFARPRIVFLTIWFAKFDLPKVA